jgi:hypothetical protein
MSFVHYEVVGHFDPRDPIVFGSPCRPKPQRSIDPNAVNRVLKSLTHSIDHIVSVAEDGYLYYEWSADLSIPNGELADRHLPLLPYHLFLPRETRHAA